jgi:predicted NAD-dependent protein-ADP-ribosyltransferase YbiA (DUF1768 family)
MVSFIAQASKSLSDANITSYDKEYRMLSNLAERNFTYDNKKYRSVEHAYQTLKSGKFDENLYTKYLQADFKNGMGPKLVGRMGTYRPITDGLMKNLIKESLAQNPDKLQLLLKTGNEKLTHKMGNDYWTNRFPEILTELREEQLNATPKTKAQTFETIKKYDVDTVRSNPDKLYIFGDNTEGWGKGGQAIIRDEPNAFGISTKNSPNEFMSDNNFEANKARIDADIEAIKADGRPIVFPEDGIGTGRADLKNKAPKTWNYLEEQINELRGKTSNNAGEIKFNKVAESGYPERTKYNAQTSDITFDFSKTSAGSGATKNYAGNKWNWVGVNNNGLMTGNKNKLANVIAENLLNGKTVNIAGHGNYKSPRKGLTTSVLQSVIDNELIEVMQLVNEKIGDKTVTGKIISGGQSGFDLAGVKAANMFGIPTEVNYSGKGLYRDATGTDIDDYQKFTQRFDTFGPRSVGAAQGNLEGQVDNISKKYNLPRGTTKKFLSSFANNVLDPMESIIVKGLTTVGLGALAGPLITYEISNILLNMFQQGEQSAAKIQLANSSIFGEALGLIEDSSEYTEGLEFEIIMDALEGVINFSELSPLMYAEDKALQVPFIRKGVDTVMEPVSEVYDTSKDYLKTGMSSVLGAFKGE